MRYRTRACGLAATCGSMAAVSRTWSKTTSGKWGRRSNPASGSAYWPYSIKANSAHVPVTPAPAHLAPSRSTTPPPAPADEAAAEKFAVQLYSDATVVDGYPGTYPPTDTGSSGLAICKVLKSRGTINGYRFARTAYGFLRLLQNGPVLQGMPWYHAFFTPDAQGFIDSDPKWPSSGLAGGHEIEAVAVELDNTDAFNSVITYVNSWGTTWGDAGRFRMRLRTYEQLNGVDLKQYRM